MNRRKKPLFRKVNTRTHRVVHDFGGDYKHTRNKKRDTREQVKGAMRSKQRRGLDYTPLYRFLLSKVGADWGEVYQEASSRVDDVERLYDIVARQEDDRKDYVATGESSYFSGLYVDEDNILQLTNPSLTAKDMVPSCSCCTHTLNGKVFGTE